MDEQEILKRISIINVKNKLQLHEIYSSGDIIYVKCPFCNSTKGDMKLVISNDSYVCKNCGERGYAIGLYAKCNYISNRCAYKKLISQKADIKSYIESPIIVNTKKKDEELDTTYQFFLQKLKLSNDHTMKLLNYGFSMEEIEKIGFKTIPTDEQTKSNICKELIQNGLELDNIPGFYQNKNFKWTFTSHKGIFIPILDNCKIVGLRIHLDKMYNTDTTDIWFSSSNKYKGSKMNNNIMVLVPNENRLHLINDNKSKKDIIVASEMLLAYKIQSIYDDKIVIGVPNVISKGELKKIDTIEGINNIYVVMDTHTILHTSDMVLKVLREKYGEEKIHLTLSIKDCEIPQELKAIFERKVEDYQQKLA